MKESALIEEFSEDQIKKLDLRKDRYEPFQWRKYNINTLFRLLKAELQELHEQIEIGDPKKIQEEAIDIANHACFIWDLAKESSKSK